MGVVWVGNTAWVASMNEVEAKRFLEPFVDRLTCGSFAA